MGWIAAFLLGLLGWVLARDVRTRRTALATISAHRDDQPGTYWAIMGFWGGCLLICAVLMWGALESDPCTEQSPCDIIVTAATQ